MPQTLPFIGAANILGKEALIILCGA